MFEVIDLKEQDFSFFGKNSVITGNFNLKSHTHIASIVKGELIVDNKAKLVIEPSGEFKGNIKCHNLYISGRIEGEITAKGCVTFYSSAKFNGKLQAKQIVVYPGAILNMDAETEV